MPQNRILFITGYFPFRQGGAEYQAFFLANKLKKSADIIFLYRDHWDKKKATQQNGFTLWPLQPIQIKGVSRPGIFELPRVNKILEKINPTAIYIRGQYTYIAAAAHFVQKKGGKLIWHIANDRNVLPFQRGRLRHLPFEYIDKKIIEYGIKHADHIVAQTDYQAGLMQKNYQLNCTVVGNWHPIPDKIVKHENPVNILWIANWKPIKQPEVFIQMVKQLISMPEVSFTMLGRTENYAKFQADAQKSGIDVKGEVSNHKVNELLSQGHILINTSRQEGFSNTFIQAWMRKVPVISLQVDPDNVLGKEGIGFCSGSFDQLVKDTKRLINDDKLRNEMGERARAYAIKNHSLKNMDKILDILAL